MSPREPRPRHEVVRTRGGALAMRSLDAGEVMHPGVGPLVEAEQLYVRQSRLDERLRLRARPTLVLFDVGLGAGSNALAAWAVSENASVAHARLELVSFERDLGALRLAAENAGAFGIVGEGAAAVHGLLARGAHQTARTSWRLEHGDVTVALAREAARADREAARADREAAGADIVFWDPFSPRANPELWTVAAFAAMRRAAGPGCTLYTYSASTATRVALLLGGWAVGVGDPIGEKAQTTAAAVNASDLTRPLDGTWLARLRRPDVPLPPDAPADALARAAAAPQFQASP